MKERFSIYDPLVQQALQAQGSQYVVPPALDPNGSMTQQIGMMNAPAPQEMALTSTDGASMYMAPRVDPMAFSGDTAGYLTEQDVLPARPVPPLARVQAPPQPMPMPEQPQPQQPRQRSVAPARPSQSMQRRDAALEGVLGSFDARQAAAEGVSSARADTARAREDLADRSAVDDMMAQQELADAADAHQAATAKIQQEQRADAEFIRNYKPSDRRTTGQRIMGAIAVALAGFADAQTGAGGGQGRAIEGTLGIINGSIDRDIDLQQRMLDNKKTALAAKNSELGQMRERYGDSVDSIKLARAMKIDQYQKELDAVVAGGASQEAAAVAKDTQAQLEMQKQQLMFDVYGQRFQAELKARQGMSASQRLTLEGKALDNEKKRQELAAGPKGDEKAQEKLAAQERVISIVDKMRKVRAENPIERGLPSYLPGVSAPAELETLASELDLEIKKAKELGTLDKGSVEFLEKYRGNPTSWGSNVDISLGVIKKGAEAERARLSGPEAQQAFDARSRLRPGAAR